MKNILPFSFLLPALFSLSISALTLPPVSLPTRSTIENAGNLTTSDNGAVACTRNPPRWAPFSDTFSCFTALRAFPTVPDVATFHADGQDDGYKIPTFERSSNCEILVEPVGPHATSRSSWTEIGLATTELIMACSNEHSTSYGGVTYAGRTNGIKITVRGYSRPRDTSR